MSLRPPQYVVQPAAPCPAAAAVAGLGAAGADALGLTLLMAQLATVPGKLSPIPAASAAASLIRLTFAGRAARRCLVLRASLPGLDGH